MFLGDEIRPLIPESNTSESTTVEVMLNDLRDGTVRIPDYQRDSDQWDEPTKSLLVESVINNLSIPAFFLELTKENNVETNEVIDGQQRLTTLADFYENKFALVSSDDAPYLSPNSVHYAGKKFGDLPIPYSQAFKKYRITVIKLRELGDMRLEIFRRINQGGTPLSGQDLRLAYWGGNSPSLAFIRLVGIYDTNRQAAKRFLEAATKQFSLSPPWTRPAAQEAWRDWWEDKNIARGQTASEMFLWSLFVAQSQQLDSILTNSAALQTLRVRFNRAIDEALDVYCAELRRQDSNGSMPPTLMTFEEMRDRFFPFFEKWIELLLAQKAPSLPVTRHRMIATLIGTAYKEKVDADVLSEQQWTSLVEFVRRAQDVSRQFGQFWPVSKGNWGGAKGYRVQMDVAQAVVRSIVDGG